jgi:hypothetical protein
LDRVPQSIYSSYSFNSKRSVFVVANGKGEMERSMREFASLCKRFGQSIHPFSLHLAMLYGVIYAKGPRMENEYITLLSVERDLLNGRLISMKLIEELSNYSQRLHVSSRDIITLEQMNNRDLSNVCNLLKDMDRLEKESKKLGEDAALDPIAHDQTRAGFLCLQDFCIDRDRKLKNRKQRVQNLIALVSQTHSMKMK